VTVTDADWALAACAKIPTIMTNNPSDRFIFFSELSGLVRLASAKNQRLVAENEDAF
jgi:hypothetical protein